MRILIPLKKQGCGYSWFRIKGLNLFSLIPWILKSKEDQDPKNGFRCTQYTDTDSSNQESDHFLTIIANLDPGLIDKSQGDKI